MLVYMSMHLCNMCAYVLCICLHMLVYMCVCAYMSMYVTIYIYIYIYIYTYVYIPVYKSICVYYVCCGVMKMGNIVPRVGIEPKSLVFQAGVLPLHHIGSLMSPLTHSLTHLLTQLCSLLPQGSMQTTTCI